MIESYLLALLAIFCFCPKGWERCGNGKREMLELRDDFVFSIRMLIQTKFFST